jgi:hypothetical protein
MAGRGEHEVYLDAEMDVEASLVSLFTLIAAKNCIRRLFPYPSGQ